MKMHSVHASIREALARKSVGQFRTSLTVLVINEQGSRYSRTVPISLKTDDGKDGITYAHSSVREVVLDEFTGYYLSRSGSSYCAAGDSDPSPEEEVARRAASNLWYKCQGPRLIAKALYGQLVTSTVPGKVMAYVELDLRRRSNDKLALVQGVNPDDELKAARRTAGMPYVLHDWGFNPSRGARTHD